jgi:hypothetical protein
MSIWRRNCRASALLVFSTGALAVFSPIFALGQERPYFVTYSHQLEEPGNLELALKTVGAAPAGSGSFGSGTLEVEYGTTGWWTTEFYLSGQKTSAESAVFTGFRLENRVRPFIREHWINPVLYVEFEDINGSDKSFLDVVGHDGVGDFGGASSETRTEMKRELELKLLLSGNRRGWNIAVNPIFEKNLSNHPWEFGYAIGASRPLRLRASADRCALCPERFVAGLEMYGGLGDRYTPGLHQTSHYLSPTLQWLSHGGTALTLGPAFGLNANSAGLLVRMKFAYEFPQIFRRGR